MGSRFPCIPKLNNMEADRVALTEKMRLIASEGNVIKLHPAAIGRFASSIEALHAPLSQSGHPARVASYRAAFRKVFENLLVHPTASARRTRSLPVPGCHDGPRAVPKLVGSGEASSDQGLAMSLVATEGTPS